jgi:hypothetical protein
MSAPVRGRKTLREIYTDTNRADAFYAAMHGVPAQNQAEIRAPRKRAAPGVDGMPLEADIQKAIMGFLRLHPKVVFVGRFNSGQAVEGNRRIWFHTLPGFPDIHGLLTDGRAFYCEVKRHDGRVTDEQKRFLERAAAAGAVAIVARSVDDVMVALA